MCTCHGPQVHPQSLDTPYASPASSELDDALLRCALQVAAARDALRRLTEVLCGEGPLAAAFRPTAGVAAPLPAAPVGTVTGPRGLPAGPAIEDAADTTPRTPPVDEAEAPPAPVVIPPVVPVWDALPVSA